MPFKCLAEDQGVFKKSFCLALHPTTIQLTEIKIQSNKIYMKKSQNTNINSISFYNIP